MHSVLPEDLTRERTSVYRFPVRVGLCIFAPSTAGWLRAALAAGEFSRSALACELCRREERRNAKGELCATSPRKALPRLAAQLELEWPPPVRRPPGRSATAAAGAPQTAFRGSLRQLGSLCLQRIDSAAWRRTWKAMPAAHRPQGVGRVPAFRAKFLLLSRRRSRFSIRISCRLETVALLESQDLAGPRQGEPFASASRPSNREIASQPGRRDREEGCRLAGTRIAAA